MVMAPQARLEDHQLIYRTVRGLVASYPLIVMEDALLYSYYSFGRNYTVGL